MRSQSPSSMATMSSLVAKTCRRHAVVLKGTSLQTFVGCHLNQSTIHIRVVLGRPCLFGYFFIHTISSSRHPPSDPDPSTLLTTLQLLRNRQKCEQTECHSARASHSFLTVFTLSTTSDVALWTTTTNAEIQHPHDTLTLQAEHTNGFGVKKILFPLSIAVASKKGRHERRLQGWLGEGIRHHHGLFGGED